MPLWSSPSPISRADSSMPSDTSPRIVRRSSVNPPGSVAPDGAYGTTMPAVMFGAPHTTRVCPLAEVDVGEADLVGVRVRQHVEDARRDHTADLAAGLLDGFDLEAELIQRGHDLGHRRGDRREVADPGEGCEHQYCARNRTSSSKNVLISSMP